MESRQLGYEDGTGAPNDDWLIQPGGQPGAAPQDSLVSFDFQSSVPPLGLGPGLGKRRRMSTSSPEDAPSETTGAASQQEPLACVSCRNRKLKCDRQKPACARCAKAGGECHYPESRRKPAFKRKNVSEIEDRLAQVEGQLRIAGIQWPGQFGLPDGAAWTEDSSPSTLAGEPFRTERLSGSPRDRAMPWTTLSPTETPSSGANNAAQAGALLGLGQFESLPPFEMIEDLHGTFFASQQHFLPIIHQANYLRSFHSPPHMRPPLCLQYAIWTAASNGHLKYGCYHDALYRRARQYLEADELKGHGEHFITIGHAQAWTILASDEARCLMFTRASMSTARSVRLAGMMGLNRLDSTHTKEELPMAPMISPPRSWAELEERRRLFWGGFCIDSYSSISAGWPTLIDVDQITTHLPVSDEAYNSSTEEKGFTLQDAFRGSDYSQFAANIITCHIFTRLLKHAHRPLPNDHPEDPEGAYWKRHRELDHMLSSAFMFLPERFRLSQNMDDPIAMQTNLNLHAAVICLHIAAREKADKFKLGGSTRQESRTRSLTAAQEIVDILKASKDLKTGYRGPLMALALYFAACVYIAQANDSQEEFNQANLEFLLKWMNSTANQHMITHAYLRQLLNDIERNGISVSMGPIPDFDSRGIPMIAQSRNTEVQPPLPGRLPLGAPQGTISKARPYVPSVPCHTFVGGAYFTPNDDAAPPASKRKRTSAAGPSSAPPHMGMPTSSTPWPFGQGGAGTSSTLMDPAPDMFEYTEGSWSYTTRYMTNPVTTLPHRMTSPAINTNNRQAPSGANPLLNFPDFSMPNADAFPPMAGPTNDGMSTATATAVFGLDLNNNNTTTTPTTTTSTNTTTNTLPNTTANPSTTTTDLNDPSQALNLDDIFAELDTWAVAETMYGMLDMSDTAGAGGEGTWDADAAGGGGAGAGGSASG